MAQITISKFGFCKCTFTPKNDAQATSFSYPANWTIPVDIQEGRGVNFSFVYEWVGDTCHITNINWKAGKIIYDEELGRIFRYCGLGRPPQDENDSDRSSTIEDHSFAQQHLLTISFNNSNLIYPALEDVKNTYISTVAQNGVYACYADNTRMSVLLSGISTKYINANFKYEYTENIEDDNIASVTYLVEINNIKIPKTSKYERNVVFTEAGVEELIDNLVYRGGDTMTGNLTVETKSNPSLILKNSDMDTTTVPTNSEYSTIYFRDKSADKSIAYIQASQANDDGHSSLTVSARAQGSSGNVNNSFTLLAYKDNTMQVVLSTKAAAAWREGLLIDKPITVNLESNNPASFNGSNTINPGVSGILPVTHGGTGLATTTNINAVVIGNSSNATAEMQTIATKSGAFFATSTNGKPQFDVLPVAQGGTGVTSLNDIQATCDGDGNIITNTYQQRHKAQTVTFTFAANSTTATATNLSNITASTTVIVSPYPAHWKTWRDNGIRCTSQGSGSLTLTTEETFSSSTDVKANIIILQT